MKAYMPAIRNAILLILAQSPRSDLLDRSGKEKLAEEILREAVRPMGIEVLAPEPVSRRRRRRAARAARARAADDAAPRKPKTREETAVRNPVQHVHFSSFIIQ